MKLKRWYLVKCTVTNDGRAYEIMGGPYWLERTALDQAIQVNTMNPFGSQRDNYFYDAVREDQL